MFVQNGLSRKAIVDPEFGTDRRFLARTKISPKSVGLLVIGYMCTHVCGHVHRYAYGHVFGHVYGNVCRLVCGHVPRCLYGHVRTHLPMHKKGYFE